MRCCAEKDQQVKINGPSVFPPACQRSTALSPSLWHPGTAHPCLPTSSLSWRAGKGGNCEGNRTSSLPVLPCCVRYTKLSHKQLAKPGHATSKCRQKQWLTQGATERGKRGVGRQHRPSHRAMHAKAKRSAQGATQTASSLPPTASHHHTRQRTGSSLASR